LHTRFASFCFSLIPENVLHFSFFPLTVPSSTISSESHPFFPMSAASSLSRSMIKNHWQFRFLEGFCTPAFDSFITCCCFFERDRKRFSFDIQAREAFTFPFLIDLHAFVPIEARTVPSLPVDVCLKSCLRISLVLI